MKRARALLFSEVSKAFELVGSNIFRRSYVDSRGRIRSKKQVIFKPNRTDDYCEIKFNGTNVRYHRLMWVLYNKSDIPEEMGIDHINGNVLDNSPKNLRLVNNRQNGQNLKTHREGKLVGCNYHKPSKKWRAEIWVKGKNRHIGMFSTEQEAYEAYLKALEGLKDDRICD